MTTYIKLALTGLIALSLEAHAQLAPMGAMYFQNQYLNNPAYAGRSKSLTIDLGLRQQWSVMPGSPRTQFVTAEYGLNERVGLGIIAHNDEAGLIKHTRVVGSYAYHLPLSSDGKKLSFGISAGFISETVDYTKLDGDGADVSVANFNQRGVYLDGDFGILYSSAGLSLQASVPNLKSFFGTDAYRGAVADEARYFAAASYRIAMPGAVAIEPKACFRSVKGFENIVDLGASLSLGAEKASVTAMYHTSQSATLGMGIRVLPDLQLTGLYTSGTAALRGETNGNFELNLKLDLFRKGTE